MESFSLIADMMYVSSNAPRIARALFEICMRCKKWSIASDTILGLCKVRTGATGRAQAGRDDGTVAGLLPLPLAACASVHLLVAALRTMKPSPVSYNHMMQALELRMWPHQHPLRQFEGVLGPELIYKMEDR